MAAKRILSVGQCAADNYSIGTFVRAHIADVEIEPVNTAVQALKSLIAKPYDLVLVNRLLDYDGTPGLDIVREMKADAELAKIPVMLVSNYADAQREAIDAGAVRGFGKANLDSAAIEQIQNALGRE